MAGRQMGIEAVVFDVGETLVDESHIWIEKARAVGVPPFTLMGLLGALIEQGLDHRDVWSRLGVPPFEGEVPIEASDLYPDALACFEDWKDQGLIVGIAGNQPDGACQRLANLGFKADFIASSADWGVSKPSPVFFDRLVDAARVEA